MNSIVKLLLFILSQQRHIHSTSRTMEYNYEWEEREEKLFREILKRRKKCY